MHMVRSVLLWAPLVLGLAGCAGPRTEAPETYPQLMPMDEILAQAGVTPLAP